MQLLKAIAKTELIKEIQCMALISQKSQFQII